MKHPYSTSSSPTLPQGFQVTSPEREAGHYLNPNGWGQEEAAAFEARIQTLRYLSSNPSATEEEYIDFLCLLASDGHWPELAEIQDIDPEWQVLMANVISRFPDVR